MYIILSVALVWFAMVGTAALNYQWFVQLDPEIHHSERILGANSPYLEVTSSGTYRCEVFQEASGAALSSTESTVEFVVLVSIWFTLR